MFYVLINNGTIKNVAEDGQVKIRILLNFYFDIKSKENKVYHDNIKNKSLKPFDMLKYEYSVYMFILKYLTFIHELIQKHPNLPNDKKSIINVLHKKFKNFLKNILIQYVVKMSTTTSNNFLSYIEELYITTIDKVNTKVNNIYKTLEEKEISDKAYLKSQQFVFLNYIKNVLNN